MLVQRFMEATAIVLGASAIALIFAPELVLARFAIEPGAAVLPLAQLYGAALFGLAITSWIARTMLLGGIYGKAVVAGGFGHALVGVFALLHARARIERRLVSLAGLCAVRFARRRFRHL